MVRLRLCSRDIAITFKHVIEERAHGQAGSHMARTIASVQELTYPSYLDGISPPSSAMN
jgi:hypothetical protein